MQLSLFESVVAQALETRCTAVCLSGGEPFLLPEHVRRAAEMCRARGRPLVVQTNGFWGRHAARTRGLLEGLAGVAQLGFSIDASHLRQLSLPSVLAAMDAAIEAGVNKLSVSVSYETRQEYEVLKSQLGERYPGIAVLGWPILPVGRAAEHPRLFAEVPGYTWDCLQRSCGAQLEFSPVVHPAGDLHLCYRVVMALERADPLILGSCARSRLDALLSSVQHRLALFLLCFGGGGLGYLLLDSPFSHLLSRRYHSVCHFCHSVLSQVAVARYIVDLLGQGDFDGRLEEGFAAVCASAAGAQELPTRPRCIEVCNGRHCGEGQRNHAVVHYMLNRLMETGMARNVDVKVVDCLRSCGSGPNFRVGGEGLLTGVTRDRVDGLVRRLAAAESTPCSSV